MHSSVCSLQHFERHLTGAKVDFMPKKKTSVLRSETPVSTVKRNVIYRKSKIQNHQPDPLGDAFHISIISSLNI